MITLANLGQGKRDYAMDRLNALEASISSWTKSLTKKEASRGKEPEDMINPGRVLNLYTSFYYLVLLSLFERSTIQLASLKVSVRMSFLF